MTTSAMSLSSLLSVLLPASQSPSSFRFKHEEEVKWMSVVLFQKLNCFYHRILKKANKLAWDN